MSVRPPWASNKPACREAALSWLGGCAISVGWRLAWRLGRPRDLQFLFWIYFFGLVARTGRARHDVKGGASLGDGRSRTARCLELFAAELWHCNLSRGSDGVDPLYPALPQGRDGIFCLLGQSSVGHYSGRRYVWQDWLGCSQRPLLWRTKKNCSASYRHDRCRAVGGIESHGPAITALSAFARGIPFRPLFGRISRRILRLDRRAGWKSQNR